MGCIDVSVQAGLADIKADDERPRTKPLVQWPLRTCDSESQFNDEWEVNGPTLNIRELGAVGDGVTNDTAAFQQAAKAIKEAGGGKLIIPAGTYIVGKQIHVEGEYPYYQEAKIFAVQGINGLIIEGEDNAVIRMADGLRLGSFHKDTGEPHYDKSTYVDSDYHVDAGVIFDIWASQNIIIRNLELDGNIQSIILGGHWGSWPGRQCSAYGLLLLQNRNVLVEDIYTHHHGLDGIQIGFGGLQESDPPTPYVLKNVVSEYNARQGLSWVGGIGLTVRDSKFNHTGKSSFASPPGAGVDIEAENAVIRDGLFCNSEFINNSGVGMVADAEGGGYTRFENCTFWGTTSWSMWHTTPGMVFEDCTFYGSIVHGYGSTEHPELAARFTRCHFEDKEHPDYGVYRNFVLHLDDVGDNVTFEACNIVANKDKPMWVTNYSVEGAKSYFRNCTVTMKNDNLDDMDWQAVIREVSIENTHFMEEFPDGFEKRYYLNVENVEVVENVVVDGPVVKWRHWEGETGTIPPGEYSSW
jgi:hypothetical protein